METIKTVNLIVKKNRYALLFKRADNDKEEPGKWGLLGGTHKEGEKFEDALKREVREESKCEIKRLKFYKQVKNKYTYEGVKYNVISYYYTGKLKGDIKLNEEHSEYKWIPLCCLPEMAFNQHTLL